MEVRNNKSPDLFGYVPLLSRNNPDNAGDLHESFQFGWEGLANDGSSRREEIRGPLMSANLWPDDAKAPRFRQAILKYYHAAVDLGRLLFPIFASALDLPEDYFEDKTQRSAAIMNLIRYPPQTSDMDERIIGIGAHTDWQCFTILWQEPGIQALQVLNSDNEWVGVPPDEGTLVINLGDQFARWTNDVFRSTLHRVYNRSARDRYSMPLFFGTDYNVKLEPIPSCVSEARPPKFEVVTAGEYVKSRFQTIYGGSSANATAELPSLQK